MGSEWKDATVWSLQQAGVLLVEDGNHGESRPRPAEFGVGKWAFVRAADMDAGAVLFDRAQRISDVARARITKGIGRGGDVLLSHKGTVGKLARAPEESPPFVCSPQTTFWRVLREDVLDRGYLYAYLRSPAFTEQLESRMSETDMAPYVSLTAQRELTVSLPPIGLQQRIATILGALDDKIDLNRRMNRTLEAMASALFKSWQQENDAVEVVASDLIDDGVLQINDGYRAKNDELGPVGPPFARAGNVQQGFVFREADRLRPENVQRAGEKVSRPFDSVFTSKGTVGRIALVLPSTESFVYSPQLCFWRSVDHARLHPLVLFQWMRSADFREQIDVLKGQTDMADYVNLRDQRDMTVSVALGAAQQPLVEKLVPLIDRSSLIDRESRTLAALRDTLLPKLLSGEVTLREAERAVGKVA